MTSIAPDHLAGFAALLLLPGLVIFFMAALRELAARGHGFAKRFLSGYHQATPVTRTAAAMLLISASIHLALAPGHWQQDPARSLLFVANGALFVALAGAAFTVRWWRAPAALTLLATLIAYAVYVDSGRESLDQVGIVTKLVELAAFGLVLIPDRSRHPRLRLTLTGVAVPLVTTLTMTALWIGAFAHPDAQHHPGADLQAVPAAATPGQQAAAQQLLDQTRIAIEPYRNPAVALAAGYRPGGDPHLPTSHWMNSAYQARGTVDPAHPPGLVYANTHHGPLLVGAMFQMPKLGQAGPDVGGPLTQWHHHTGVCIAPIGFELDLETPMGNCPLGAVSLSAPAMLHVWIVQNPGGPFALDLDPKVVSRLVAGS